MKQKILLFLLALLPLMANADVVNAEIDGICYIIDTTTGTAEVTRNPNGYIGDVIIPETIVYFSANIPVTSIGEAAFYECVSLTSLVVPKNVKSIGHFVFDGCANLNSIVVNSENKKYDSRDHCNAIIETETNKLVAGCKNTIIPNSVTSIGYSAFYGCLGLKELTIPNSVTSIGGAAFERCTGLTSVIIPSSVTTIEASVFANCTSLASIVIPTSVTSIELNAFYHCDALTSIVIPNSVTSFSDYVFEDCNNLVSIVVEEGNPKYDSRDHCNAIIETETNKLVAGCKNTVIPNSVSSISANAFCGCRSLKDITIPNSVTSIEYNAFGNCEALTSIVIPSSVISVGIQVFSGCNNLVSIIVEKGNPKYDSRDNCNAIVETASNALVVGCKNTVIPNSITSIKYDAFSGCFGLKKINIPNSVISIGSFAFSGCDLTSVVIPNSVTTLKTGVFRHCSLESVVIPEGVTSIEEIAFDGCFFMTSVTIPNSVTFIGQYAFGKCEDITNIYCYATDVPSTDMDAFEEYALNNATLHVPSASIEAYKVAEPWKNFKEIVALSDESTDVDDITIKEIGKTTWCSEYDLDFTNVVGVKAYTATGYDDNDKTIWLTRVMKVPAGTGLLIKGNAGTYKIPRVNVRATYLNYLKGNLGETIKIEETDGDMTNYYLSGKDGTFVSVSGNANIGKNKAYLQLPTSIFAGTRTIGVSFDDEDGTTGIKDVKSSSVKDGEWYTLQGQRVQNPGKGLYIHNGKKVVIK